MQNIHNYDCIVTVTVCILPLLYTFQLSTDLISLTVKPLNMFMLFTWPLLSTACYTLLHLSIVSKKFFKTEVLQQMNVVNYAL